MMVIEDKDSPFSSLFALMAKSDEEEDKEFWTLKLKWVSKLTSNSPRGKSEREQLELDQFEKNRSKLGYTCMVTTGEAKVAAGQMFGHMVHIFRGRTKSSSQGVKEKTSLMNSTAPLLRSGSLSMSGHEAEVMNKRVLSEFPIDHLLERDILEEQG
ncbi:hypothetical protein HAX54_015790 [Datura stramonium]|uniref:Uncharacterized protein n=1 Tax=Datura stramonium TaxID=4076 RepID=A0ABS8UK00_DATST|nr:hypothetical protein [Datura stramonium]